MALLIGAVLAIVVGLMATGVGMDRDRALYPAITMVVASYYVLFAILGGSTPALWIETVVALVFVALAMAGFRGSLWLAVAALGAHGLLDLVHGRLIANPGVPAWWPPFCMSYDVAAAAYLAPIADRVREGTLQRDEPYRSILAAWTGPGATSRDLLAGTERAD